MSVPLLQISVQLHIPMMDQWVLVQWPLVDLGATNNFIDVITAWALKIPLQCKVTPDLMEIIDGSPLSSSAVTEKTSPLETIIQGHWETIQFSTIYFLHFPLILGIPRLTCHHPLMHW